jgi:hypothetical protein
MTVVAFLGPFSVIISEAYFSVTAVAWNADVSITGVYFFWMSPAQWFMSLPITSPSYLWNCNLAAFAFHSRLSICIYANSNPRATPNWFDIHECDFPSQRATLLDRETR